MISLAWHTVRAHKATLVGSFVALALGVALLAAMGLTLASTVGAGDRAPTWFTRADVVVSGAGTVTISSGTGDDRETETVATGQSRALPGDLPGRLAGLAAGQIVDYTGYGQVAGAPGDSVHPWAAAGLHGYRWVAGGAPVRADQVVLSAPTGYRPGDPVTAQTADGPRRFTVSGVLSSAAPAALYVSDPVAKALAGGRISGIGLIARPGQHADQLAGAVRAQLRAAADAGAASDLDGVRVLTGDGRRAAEPDPDRDLFAVAVSLLGTTSGLAGFVSIFVVAGTFAYAVAARRREFGLLRTAGATPRQVRRLVLGEALAVGVVASLAGDALGTVLAPPFASWLARSGFAPPTFTAHLIFWPLAAAFGLGLLVALIGAGLAARRAGRVRPAEALREASVDRRAMTLSRWLVGLAAFGGSVPLLGVLAAAHSADATLLILVVAMLLIIGCAMFAPLLIPPLVAVLGAPLAGARGAVGMLARRNAVTAIRRTAATAAPILVTVGIAGSTLACFATLNGTEQRAAQHRIVAPMLIVPAGSVAVPGAPSPTGAVGLADSTLTTLAALPGVSAAIPTTDTQVYRRTGGDLEDYTGRYVNGPDLAGALDLPLAAGTLTALTGTDTVAVPVGWAHLGDRLTLWLDDSTPLRLRVVALLANQIDLSDTVLLPWALRAAHTARPLADTVYLRLAPGADLTQVRQVATTGGGQLVSTGNYLSATDADQARTNRLALFAVLGLALLYTGIAIANTLVLATGDRAAELAALRLAGATPRQVLRMIGVEALLVTGIGLLLGFGVSAVALLGMRAGLTSLAPAVPLIVPWSPIGGIAAACLVIAVLASLSPAAVLLRRRPVELAGIRE